ncbi:MAG TPA: TolC family protein [Gammaproteobacteria bacterium]|nr:TolC family protein [Gammaproteobacteria bacterium]
MRRFKLGAAIVVAILAYPGVAAAQTDAGRSPFGQSLTVDALVAAVISESPRLAAIDALAEAAAYRVEVAGAFDDPTLSLATAPRSSDSNIDVSQRLPWPGTLRARESAAESDVLATRRRVDVERLMLTLAAKSAYAEWYFIERAIAVHAETEVLLDQIIATAETRYAAGSASRQDVLQAEVERANLEAHGLGLMRRRTATLAHINALMSRPPDAALPPAGPIPVGQPLLDAAALERRALDGHPELRQLDAEIAGAENRAELAELAFRPDFQVRAGYNTLWDESDKRPVIGVSINVPLARSKRRAEQSRAEAETRRAQSLLADRRAVLLGELARARAEVEEAAAIVDLHERELLPLADEYLAVALADYESGSGAFLNVMTAEDRLLSIRLAGERARADYLRSLADLERWAGGPVDALSAR